MSRGSGLRTGFAICAGLVAIASFAAGVPSASTLDPNYISVGYTSAEQEPRLSVRIVDDSGWDISPTASGLAPIRIRLTKDGVPVEIDAVRKDGSYSLRVGYRPNAWVAGIRLRKGVAARVTIRPAVVRIGRNEIAKSPEPTRLVFTAAREVSAEVFARDGCKVVTPNIATVAEMGPRTANATSYLPPGLYRVIPRTGDRFGKAFFVRLQAGRAFQIALTKDGAEPETPAEAPVYDGKCYY